MGSALGVVVAEEDPRPPQSPPTLQPPTEEARAAAEWWWSEYFTHRSRRELTDNLTLEKHHCLNLEDGVINLKLKRDLTDLRVVSPGFFVARWRKKKHGGSVVCQIHEIQDIRDVVKISTDNHPNLIPHYGYFVHQGWFYAVTCASNLMDARRLDEFIRFGESGGSNSEMFVAFCLHDVMEGLLHLHNQSIVHNNISPETIFGFTPATTTQRRIVWKLGGYHYSLRKISCLITTMTTKRTMINESLIPPECRRQQPPAPPPHPLHDVWSIGMLCYILLTRTIPPPQLGRVSSSSRDVALLPPLVPSVMSSSCSHLSDEAKDFIAISVCPIEQRCSLRTLMVHPFIRLFIS